MCVGIDEKFMSNYMYSTIGCCEYDMVMYGMQIGCEFLRRKEKRKIDRRGMKKELGIWEMGDRYMEWRRDGEGMEKGRECDQR